MSGPLLLAIMLGSFLMLVLFYIFRMEKYILAIYMDFVY